MELKIGAFRTCNAKQLDDMLATEGEIIIIVGKHPRFVVSKYDSVKPELKEEVIEHIFLKPEPEGEQIADTILDKADFLADTERKYRVKL